MKNMNAGRQASHVPVTLIPVLYRKGTHGLDEYRYRSTIVMPDGSTWSSFLLWWKQENAIRHAESAHAQAMAHWPDAGHVRAAFGRRCFDRDA